MVQATSFVLYSTSASIDICLPIEKCDSLHPCELSQMANFSKIRNPKVDHIRQFLSNRPSEQLFGSAEVFSKASK